MNPDKPLYTIDPDLLAGILADLGVRSIAELMEKLKGGAVDGV